MLVKENDKVVYLDDSKIVIYYIKNIFWGKCGNFRSVLPNSPHRFA